MGYQFVSVKLTSEIAKLYVLTANFQPGSFHPECQRSCKYLTSREVHFSPFDIKLTLINSNLILKYSVAVEIQISVTYARSEACPLWEAHYQSERAPTGLT